LWLYDITINIISSGKLLNWSNQQIQVTGNNSHGWRNLFQSGGAQVHVKKKLWQILWFELASVTSQALKCDVITYIPSEGLNYTILDKTKPLWKRIGGPPEIQIGCYRGDPSHQRHSG